MTDLKTMNTAQEVLAGDLEDIAARADGEFRAMAGKTLLITGGAGFLGYYLVQGVLHWNRTRSPGRPVQLTVCDNYIRGVPEWLSALEGDASLTLRKHDVTDRLPDEAGHFDYVIHAASIASPIYYRKHPIETMDANVTGLRLLLDRCVEAGRIGRPVSGFLFFSTSEIYGDPVAEEIPTREEYRGNVSCTGPRACYDESKRYGETLCVNFARVHGLPVTMARPFNNYGPGLKITDRRVIPDFARDMFAGRDLVLLSDGSPTRTFCYVTDAIVGYYKILVRGRPGEAYNIGIDKPEISVLELARTIAEVGRRRFGYQGQVIQAASEDRDYLTDNPQRRCPVIEKARRELGFEPRVPLHEGIERSLVWYGDNRVAEEA
jgi:UDP-glucuronate decarboxylase